MDAMMPSHIPGPFAVRRPNPKPVDSKFAKDAKGQVRLGSLPPKVFLELRCLSETVLDGQCREAAPNHLAPQPKQPENLLSIHGMELFIWQEDTPPKKSKALLAALPPQDVFYIFPPT